MTVEEKIQAVLLADSGVSALVGTSIKVGFVGQSLAVPYISHQTYSNREVRTHEGRAKIQFWDQYRIKGFAETYSGARALNLAIMAAVKDLRATGIQVTKAEFATEVYEDPEGIHQQVVELSIADTL